MYNITFYAPPSHVEDIKQAMFAAGAGKMGNYSQCAWQTLGDGQCLPLSGSQPYIGEEQQLETITEYMVQMICKDADIHQVIAALKVAHPYETPAYHVVKIEEL